ncbi:recombinase family protein [Paraburkholderia rhizosphaerae]|uniref:Putative DNA-invertase from lambdoid prophage Rac n=1 Tax=Paraburkholderia rhizosphaerae TaxID=480658 RepID=A0A4R8LKG1_9BURK|nr:helix-turn-helix domain-containing protein [Paraburkholderia rhizosphaerae]TDY43894.1 putative DNA-invertase from lambdoid prophage Rac [Paraburkholderia rhizosphaerae]
MRRSVRSAGGPIARDASVGKVHIYLLGAADPFEREHELIELDKAGYTVALGRLTTEDVPAYTPARERPELQSLLRRLMPRHTLAVLEFAALGCSARDILDTLMQARKAKVSIRCVEVGRADLAALPEAPVVKALRALARLDVACRSLRSKDGLAALRAEGKPTGRPPSLTVQQRQRVLQSLDKGQSVSEVARRFGTSRQTVLRIRLVGENAAAT